MGAFGEIYSEIQDGGPIWPTFGNHDVVPAS